MCGGTSRAIAASNDKASFIGKKPVTLALPESLPRVGMSFQAWNCVKLSDGAGAQSTKAQLTGMAERLRQRLDRRHHRRGRWVEGDDLCLVRRQGRAVRGSGPAGV